MQEKAKWVRTHIMDFLIWGVIGFFTMLYISLIFNQNVWTDEVFTMDLLKGSLGDIIEGTAKDVHPPLYYFWAKIFYQLFGTSIQVQKIAAIIPMTGTLVYLAIEAKKYFGDLATFITLAFLCCIPCTMEFAVQIRMYSLAMFFVTLCGLSAYAVFTENRKKDWICLIIGAVGAAYTHYFAFVSVLFVIGFLFLTILFCKKNLLKNWLISVIVMLILYLPWLKSFITQVTLVRADYWIPPITEEVIWSYFTWAFDLTILPGTVYGFLIILVFVGTVCLIRLIKYKEKEDVYALLCMLVPTATAVFGVVVSMSKSPIYRDQYIMPSLALLALFVGIMLAKSNWKIWTIVCAFFLFVGAVQYKECYRQEYKSTYIDKTLEFFEENLGEEDYILYNLEAMDFIYKFYFPEEKLVYIQDFDLSGDFKTAWFLDTPNQWPITQLDLINNGLTMEFMGLFGIEHNEFDLYKVYKAE